MSDAKKFLPDIPTMFSLGSDKPKEAEPVPVVETDREKARINRMRAYQRKYGKAGRAGTVLTEDSKLG